jgi:threonine synthase
MEWYSTANRGHRVSFKEAVLQGLAPAQGLYMPAAIPRLPDAFFEAAPTLSLQQQATHIASAFLDQDLPAPVIRSLAEQTLTFDVPLVEIEENTFSLELFHGPTLAFKDVGARFMAQLLGFYARGINRRIVVLAATSGDTGGAVAHGFYRVPGVEVVVLYPSGRVSELQEKQFTTLGHNITALEIDGTFDDCQRLVKEAFSDQELNARLFLTSANSINVGRLLPQIFYYVYAWSRAPKHRPIVFSVPSGNFGNLVAGLFAQRLGLPRVRLIAATNRNEVVPAYLRSGVFQPRASQATISNAMDVGNPSNFARILDLFNHRHAAVAEAITGFAFADEQTENTMRRVYASTGYCLDPHGAVAYLGLQAGRQPNETGIFLETAHPAKFNQAVEKVLQRPLPIPEPLAALAAKDSKSIFCKAGYAAVKQALIKILLAGS